MPRKRLIRHAKFPYHITTRCNNKEWFELQISEVWELFLISLENAQRKCPVVIHCFVLMNNHYHLMMTTPCKNIDEFMQVLNKRFSDEIRKRSRVINHKFAGRYKWSLINDESYLANCYRYIFQNPVKANIVSRVEQYPYSSLWYSRLSKKIHEIVIELDISMFEGGDFMEWLNKIITDESYTHIRNGLRNSTFKISARATNEVRKEMLLR